MEEIKNKIEGIDQQYKKIEKTFFDIKRKYSGLRGLFKTRLAEQDKKILFEYNTSLIHIITELTFIPSESEKCQDIANLCMEIGDFMSDFKNTGIKKYYRPYAV